MPLSEVTKTNRGFSLIEFRDLYGHTASLQESSLATDEAVWLGLDEGIHHHGKCLARMHLNREMAGQLAKVLAHFAETGEVSALKETD